MAVWLQEVAKMAKKTVICATLEAFVGGFIIDMHPSNCHRQGEAHRFTV